MRALGTVKCSQCRALPWVLCATAAALEGSSDQPSALVSPRVFITTLCLVSLLLLQLPLSPWSRVAG